MGEYSASAVPGLVSGTWSFHVNTNGWADIAYNFSVDRFGRIWEGRGDLKWNAASGDTYANSRYLAVECLCGKGDSFTDAMKGGLAAIAAAYIASGRTPRMYCHRDVVATECPGDEIVSYIRLLDKNMQMGAGFTPQRGSVPISDDEGEDMPEYLIQASDKTMYGVYPSGKTRQLIYPELQYLQRTDSDITVVKSDNRENDQILAHRAQLG
jgi:hypothetical protein